MSNNKLSPNLSLAAIAIKYDVNAKGIDSLLKAIEAGEISAMLKDCADERFDGDLKPVMAQFNRNLSSQRCTRKITDTASKNRADMVEALWAMTHSTQGTGDRTPKAGFQYTRDEVDALVAEGNVAELQRFYNNVHSNVNKALSGLSTSCYAEELASNPKLARWVDVKEYVSEQLRTLKASAKVSAKTKEQPKVELSDDLAKKLASYQAGKKASFTAEQMAELIELVKALG